MQTALEALVGKGNVFGNAADIAPYAEDGRGQGVAPAMVVRPRGTTEIIAVATLIRDNGYDLVIQGARTGLVSAGLPSNLASAIVVSLERHNQQLVIDPYNRTAVVDAGVTLAQLNEAAARYGLVFPIDLGANPSVGGMIAANTGGARFLRYGDVRRNILAIECLSPDWQSIMQLGRGVWKDNSSLNLRDCIIGSSGALSLVTSATLALQPKSNVSCCALLAMDDVSAVPAILKTVEAQLGTLLTAFEGMSENAMNAALDHVPALRSPFPDRKAPPYSLLIEASAPLAMSASMLEEIVAATLMPFLTDSASNCSDILIGRSEDCWSIRHAIPAALRAKGSVVACDVSVPRGSFAAFHQTMVDMFATRWPGLCLCDFGHIGDGGLHLNSIWVGSPSYIPDGLRDEVQGHVFDIVVRDFGGSFSAEHGIGPSNFAHYQKHTLPAVRELSGHIQRAFSYHPLGRVQF
jgi:FAD/FMN-containing dehydrogenase